MILVPAPAVLVIRAETLLPVSGPARTGVDVMIENGKIARIGPNLVIPIGARVVAAKVVTPGFVDCWGTVGLAGALNVRGTDQDALDRSGPIQPEVRALDAFNPREPLVRWVRSRGVTTVLLGFEPGEVVQGTMSLVKLRDGTADACALVPEWGVAAALGPYSLRDSGAPGTRGKQAAVLREELIKARAAASEGATHRTRLLKRLLAREIPLVLHADRAQDIATALRLANEFGLRVILAGASEATAVLDEIRRAKAAVFLHPAMDPAEGDKEEMSFETAGRLADAGLPFGLTTGYVAYVPKTRVLPFEAAIFAAYGLGEDRALRAMTLDAARLLGIDGRVGSIEVGKDADLALFDGPPLEPTTRCVGTVIDGVAVEDGEIERIR